METYETVISSAAFLADLNSLNTAIADALRAAGEPVAINGNVCYPHLKEDFHLGDLSPLMEAKRRALVVLAQRSTCFVEVGVAGGHALLIALHANPDIKCIGIDLAQRLRASWPPVEVFVPATFEWFRSHYPHRTLMLQEEAISGLSKVVTDQPFGPVNLLHLDGDKRNRFAELRTIWPGLAEDAYLMQGDTRNGHVVADTNAMMAQGLAKPVDDKEIQAIAAKNFQCLEIGKNVYAQSLTLDDLIGKRVLLCVAHQDDETLFAGGLLDALKGRATVTIASFFALPKGAKTHIPVVLLWRMLATTLVPHASSTPLLLKSTTGV
ncbi:hypothetical protein [Yoonia algicola]|uniref:Uncharacterized protein n=1 Tax=Yoonia algicola TaxID=3137368 RepID=A0AAN0M4F9_9RHOB